MYLKTNYNGILSPIEVSKIMKLYKRQYWFVSPQIYEIGVAFNLFPIELPSSDSPQRASSKIAYTECRVIHFFFIFP